VTADDACGAPSRAESQEVLLEEHDILLSSLGKLIRNVCPSRPPANDCDVKTTHTVSRVRLDQRNKNSWLVSVELVNLSGSDHGID